MKSIYEAQIDDLAKPIREVEEKWKLLPHFLRLRGLMRQHIDSFDHFMEKDIKAIVQARSNREVSQLDINIHFFVCVMDTVHARQVRSEADPKFFVQYTDIYVGEPNIEEEAFVTTDGSYITISVNNNGF